MPLPRSLPALVRAKFKSAQEMGDLTFYATQVTVLSCSGLPFQVRFSPALANKPKSNKPKDSKPVDPFENPSRGLYITELTPAHYLVLNKFPVIPDHFILATKDFKEQTDLLEEIDIAAAYACLGAYRDDGEELFGFFNSGEHSGASQPHRHIQFLPVKSMRSGVEERTTWNVLADSLGDGKHLPFSHFVSRLPENPTPSQLHQIYTILYDKALKEAERFSHVAGSSFSLLENSRGGQSRISYNMGLTDRVMILCPRVAEGLKIRSHDGELVGPIALNGTVLGGTLLVKSEAEYDALRTDESKLKDILEAIGIPPFNSSHDEHL